MTVVETLRLVKLSLYGLNTDVSQLITLKNVNVELKSNMVEIYRFCNMAVFVKY